jgi:hypothetical protein
MGISSGTVAGNNSAAPSDKPTVARMRIAEMISGRRMVMARLLSARRLSRRAR